MTAVTGSRRPPPPPSPRARTEVLLAIVGLVVAGAGPLRQLGAGGPPLGDPWGAGALACLTSGAVAGLVLRGRVRRAAAVAFAVAAVAFAGAAGVSVAATDALPDLRTGSSVDVGAWRAWGADRTADEAPAGDDRTFRVLSWNVLWGFDRAAGGNGWRERRSLLADALALERPDILGVQEATGDQVAFLEAALPEHARIGVGRDDGAAGGEHCALYLARARFEVLDSGTFWLSDTPDRPSRTWAHPFPRICTWARVADRRSGRTLRVFDTHLPLVAAARRQAAELIASRVVGGEPALLLGDLNCGPGSAPWRAFESAGLREAAALAGGTPPRTFHVRGIPLACLDAVLVDAGAFEVRDLRACRWRRGGAFPSDHFGVAVVLAWR